MKVKDWMSSTLITVGPETGLTLAWDLMRERRIRHLLVVRDNRLLGILSDRDIRLALPSPATSLSAWEINHLLLNVRVETVMTPAPITIHPERQVRDVAAIMLEHRIGALPVVDEWGVRGIITQTDVLKACASAPAALRGADEESVPDRREPAALRTILVPVDRDGDQHRAIAAAGALARRAGARLRVLHVAPMPEAVVDSAGRTVSYSDQEAARVEHVIESELRAAAADIHDVPVEPVVRFGEAIEEIVREAEAADVDVIVMATHRRTGVRRLIQGSIAEDVERATTRPVLLVPYAGPTGSDGLPVLAAHETC